VTHKLEMPQGAFDLTEAAAAQQFAAIYAHEIRYNHEKRRWFVWRDGRWAPDSNGAVERLMKGLSVDYSMAATTAMAAGETDFSRALSRFALRLNSSAGLSGVLKSAQTENPLSLAGDEFDRHEMLFNVQNGTIELARNAAEGPYAFRPASPKDLLTLQASVEYQPGATAPKFEAFIDDTFGGDQELCEFVRRLAGYTLAAGNPEQILVICHGEGKNGKSTLLNLLRDLLGGYGQALSDVALLTRHGGAISNDLYDLQKVRLAISPDFAKSNIDEGLLKQLSGGDRVRARPLFGHNIEYRPDLTVFIASNHKPHFDAGDSAIWRRLILVPFSHVVPEARRNVRLAEELLCEGPGILNWMLQGYADYLQAGLAVPTVVLGATQQYRDEADQVKRFIAERCEARRDIKQPAAELQAEFARWARDNGEPPLRPGALKERLSALGYPSQRNKKQITYEGLRLLAESDCDSDQQEEGTVGELAA
jgi:putative DNA primase/helicase